jgi:hypothetical protein
MTNYIPEQRNLIPQQSSDINRRLLITLETFTVFILSALTFWSVRPLVEEWDMFVAFNSHGLGFLTEFLPSTAMRPLHFTAFALQWIIGNGQPFGVAAATAVILVARYLVTRWAVSPLLVGYERWVISTLAASLVLWPGVWLGRYGPAQLSAVLFFVALGFAIRLSRRWSVTMAIGCAVSVLLLLSMYQGLVLCLLAIPLFSFMWRNSDHSLLPDLRQKIFNALRLWITLGAGFALYGAYCLFISSKVGSGGYEAALAGDGARLLTIAGLFTHIKSAFFTTFGGESLLLPLCLSIVLFLSRDSISDLPTLKSKVSTLALVSSPVILLPLFSLIYVSALHINDIDRVLYPVSTAFVLVCLTILSYFRKNHTIKSSASNISFAVIILLVASSSIAFGTRQYGEIQKSVLTQALAASEKNKSTSIVIRDTTGVLGDVYTLYVGALSSAMSALGKSINGTICTPLSVDRIHPVAQRFPVVSTPRCEEIPQATIPPLVLTARWDNGNIVVE